MLGKRHGLITQIPGVESVKVHALIAAFSQQGLEAMPCGHRGDRFGRFHQYHPWAIDGQINAGECFGLTALDIDFHKVNLGQQVLPKNRIERPDFHRAHLAGKTMLRGNRCRTHIE